MTSAARPPPGRRGTDARRAYRYAFLGLALITVVLSALLSFLVTTHRNDARYIDEAGLERTRSQQIAFLAIRLAARNGSESERDELAAATGDFRKAAPLVSIGAGPNLERDIARYANDADAARRGGSERTRALAALLARRLALLEELDRAVHLRASRGTASNDRLVLTILVLTMVLLAAAGLAWQYVIVPFERRERHGAQRLRALFDNHPEAIATYDLDGSITSGNAASLRLIGRRAMSIGTHFTAHVASEALPAALDAFARSATGETTDFETAFERGDGERRVVLANLFPNRVDGKIVGVYAIGRDITALTHARAALGESEQRFRALFEQNPDSIAILDTKGKYLNVNAATEKLTGIPAASFVGNTRGSLNIGKPDALRLSPEAMRELAQGRSVTYETQIVNRAGQSVDVHGKAVPILYDRRIQGFFSIARDVTDERRARSEIVEGAKRIADLYLVAASSGRSSDEQIASALELGRTRLGYDRSYLVHVRDNLATVRMAVGDDVMPAGKTVPLARTMLRHSLATGDIHVVDDAGLEPWRSDPAMAEHTVRSFASIPISVDGVIDGALVFDSDAPHGTPFTQSDLDFVRLIAALLGSTVERGRQRAKLDALAFYDLLTGLPNRVLLDDRMNELIREAGKNNRTFGVLFIDLDNFKGVNDAWGHGVGDDVLRSVAQRLSRAAGKSDTVARLGGDEFVIIMPEARSVADACELAQRIVGSLRKPFTFGERAHVLGGSVGIAFYPDHGLDVRTLLERADRALYRAKTRGRGSYDVYAEDRPSQRAAP